LLLRYFESAEDFGLRTPDRHGCRHGATGDVVGASGHAGSRDGVPGGARGARADGVRFALINPNWTFDGSIYFGCREPHLPLELGYAQAILKRAGHDVRLIDAHLDQLEPGQVQAELARFQPDFTVIPTAPTYLFWRCAPPELTVPQRMLDH